MANEIKNTPAAIGEDRKVQDYLVRLASLRSTGVTRISELKQQITATKKSKMLSSETKSKMIDDCKKQLEAAKSDAAAHKSEIDALAKEAVNYDYILIDCPPSLSLITINALVAADAVIIPLQCEFLALEGISDLIRNINTIKKNFNPALSLQGVVLTMYDKRNNLTQMVEDDVRGFFGKKVYDTVIPRNVRISEAPSHGKPVLLYDFKCPGSQAYIGLTKEVLKRERELIAC